MAKTIEEVAKSIAKDFIIENKSRINNDAPLTYECVQYAIERIMSLPLVSRLTAEEKGRVRELYCEAKLCSPDVDMNRLPEEAYTLFYLGKANVLESIFGKDFFKEGE